MNILAQEGMIMESTSSTIRVIKSRRFRWEGHVARMEEGRSALKIITSKPTETTASLV